MTKKAVEENHNVGKLDWDVMNNVLKNTVNLDDEGKIFKVFKNIYLNGFFITTQRKKHLFPKL